MREQLHIESALEQQKHEHQKSVAQAVATALEHHREKIRLEQEKKASTNGVLFKYEYTHYRSKY